MARHNNLDALRLLFAALVVLAHANVLMRYDLTTPLLHASGWAVDGFFIVSGMLVLDSWRNRPELRAYALRRFFRIWPLCATLVVVQAAVLWAVQPAVPAREVAGYLGANLVFLNFLAQSIGPLLDGTVVPAANGSLWTLKIEAAFYVAVPLLAWMLARAPRLVLTVCFFGSLAWVVACQKAGIPVLAHQLPGKMHLFALGMALALWHHRPPTWALGVAGASIAVAQMTLDLPPDDAVAQALRGLLLACLIPLAAFRLPVMRLRMDLSYGLYLVHFPLIQVLVVGGWAAGLGPLEGIGLVVVMSVVAAAVLHVAVERPAIELGRRLARRKVALAAA